MDNTSFEAEPVWKQEHIATSDNWCGWYYTQRQKGRSSLPFHLSTKACDIWGTEKQTSNPCIFPPNMVSIIIYGHWIASEHDFLDQWILDLCFLLFSYVFRSFFEDVSFEKHLLPSCFEISLPLCAASATFHSPSQWAKNHMSKENPRGGAVSLCWIY